MRQEDTMLRDMRDAKQRELQYFEKRYKKFFDALGRSPLSKARSITEWDHYALGKQLAAYELMKMDLNEADGNTASLGTLPRIALETISAFYGASPLNVFAGVQPIEEQQGLIYFRNFVAQTNRGNVQAGDKLIDARNAPGRLPTGGFTGNGVINETVINANGDDSTVTFTGTLGGGKEFMTPLDPRLVTVKVVASFTGPATLTFPTMTPDVTTGVFSGAALNGSTLVAVRGTVNYTSGAVSMTFSTAPLTGTGNVDCLVSYSVMPEGSSDLPKAILVMESMPVQAQDYILKSTIGLFEAYNMRKRFGLIAEEEMAKDLTAIVNQEITNQAILMLLAGIPSGNNVAWVRQAQTGTSTFEHQLTLKNALTDANALLIKSAGRGSVNVMLAGLKACAVLEMLPGFKKLYDDSEFGAHIYGTLDGITVVRVPYSDILDDNTIVMIHKGKNPYDAPIVWSPYMPMFVTNTLPGWPNPTQQQRAVAVSGALSAPVPNLTTKVTIDQTGFNYA